MNLISLLLNFLMYMSIPLLLRFVILRRPIENKWLVVAILIPLFIGFSILINVQRDEAQQAIFESAKQKLGITTNAPYKPTTHTFGSPLLYLAMYLSYRLLRRNEKKIKPETENRVEKISNEKRSGIKLLSKEQLAELRNDIGKEGFTELMHACCAGDVDRVSELINQGATLNDRASNGNTALIYAAGQGYFNCVKLLLEHGADANAVNNKKLTAYDYALKNDDNKIIEILAT